MRIKANRNVLGLAAAGILLVATALVGTWQVSRAGHARQGAPAESHFVKPNGASAAQGLSPAPISQLHAATQSVPTVTATVDEHSDSAVNAAQFQLDYPADKLSFQSVSGGSAFPVALSADTSVPGVVKIARGVTLGAPGISGTHVIETVTFTKKPGSSGPYSVAVDKQGSALASADTHTDLLPSGAGTITVSISQ